MDNKKTFKKFADLIKDYYTRESKKLDRNNTMAITFMLLCCMVSYGTIAGLAIISLL